MRSSFFVARVKFSVDLSFLMVTMNFLKDTLHEFGYALPDGQTYITRKRIKCPRRYVFIKFSD